ncbi:hypothetical protein [Chitinophaga sp.]|uniref:hypothetical protein n=1 Tax=Chitinophaga sp. TaxID=1869181 RepID=UPI0031D3C721
MTYNPTTIANYFITTYATIQAPMTVNQIIGLTYYAYGWYIGYTDCQPTLIKEPLICKSTCAVFGSLWENMLNTRGNLFYRKIPNPQGNQTISKEDQHFLDMVWNTYGHLESGVANKAFIYDEDNPWKTTIVTGQLIIPMSLVYSYFKNQLIKAGQGAA